MLITIPKVQAPYKKSKLIICRIKSRYSQLEIFLFAYSLTCMLDTLPQKFIDFLFAKEDFGYKAKKKQNLKRENTPHHRQQKHLKRRNTVCDT